MDTHVIYEKIQTEYKSPIKVVEINISNDLSDRRMPKHWHRSIEFVLPFENGSEIWIEGQILQCQSNEMLLINSRRIHECGSIYPNLPYKGYAIQLKYDFLVDVIPNIDHYVFKERFDRENDSHLFNLMEKIIATYKNKEGFQYLKLQSLAYELAYELVTNCCIKLVQNKMYESSKNKTRLIEVLNYLDKNSSEQFDAIKIADKFHISYGHLAKLFKTELGMTLTEYVNSIRVRNATFDLLSTNLPIIDIAMQHGFASSKAFYKEFDKIYHMTPKQYRKNERQL